MPQRPDDIRLTLMCRDHEVCELLWDSRTRRAHGALRVIDGAHLPYGAQDERGQVTKPTLSAWINARGIPALRPDAQNKIRQLGFLDATDMLTAGHGLSLSDQYWLKHESDAVVWPEISPYLNDFSPDLGIYLVARGDDTIARLASVLSKQQASLGTSPDASLGGNLTKRWVIENGLRILLKRGSDARHLQEPVNELIATRLAMRLLSPDEFVSYGLRGSYPNQESACSCICTDLTELVPAYDIIGLSRRKNHESYCSAYVRICQDHGIDIRKHLEKMLVVDHILCNTDRHWRNFGIIVDSESRQWLRPAPIFDNGNSLWSDHTMEEGFGPYHLPNKARRPFLTHEHDQLEAYCDDLSWLDLGQLDGFVEEMAELLALCPPVAYEPGRLDAIARSVSRRIRHVAEWQVSLQRRRSLEVAKGV